MHASAFQLVADPGSSTRRPVNLSLSTDVVEAAKALGINVSQFCDAALRNKVREEQRQLWKEQHKSFISSYNDSVEKEGLPLERWRTF